MKKSKTFNFLKMFCCFTALCLMGGFFVRTNTHETHAEEVTLFDGGGESICIEQNKFQGVYPGSTLTISYEYLIQEGSDTILIKVGENELASLEAPSSEGSKRYVVSEEFLQKINGDVTITSSAETIYFMEVKIELAPAPAEPTISDILPSNFPVSQTKGWVSEKGVCVYLSENKLHFEHPTKIYGVFDRFSITDIVEKDGNNYKVIDNDTSDAVIFEMRSNDLVSITLNTNNIASTASMLKGKFTPVFTIEDSNGAAAIKDEDYQLESDKLTILKNDLTISGTIVDKCIHVNTGVNLLTFNALIVIDSHNKAVYCDDRDAEFNLRVKGSNKISFSNESDYIYGIYFNNSGAIIGDGNLSIIGNGVKTIGIYCGNTITFDCSGNILIDVGYFCIRVDNDVVLGQDTEKILCYISETGSSTIYATRISNNYGKTMTGSTAAKAKETEITDSININNNYKPCVNEDVALSLLIKVNRVTINDILPSNFPITSELGWINEHSLSAYRDNENLQIGNVNLPLNTLLINNGLNYIYSNVMYDVEFVMVENKLASIVVSRVLSSTANGTFKPVVELAKPSKDLTDFVYTGLPLTYTIEANDAYTVTGNVQTDAGTYVVTVALNDKVHYHWTDGTTTDVEFEFVINNKAEDVKITENGTEVEPSNAKVRIIDAENGIDPNAIFVVEVVAMEQTEEVEQSKQALENNNKLAENEKIFGIYDAKLLVDGAEVQPNGTITIKMLVPEEIRNNNFKLYHIHNGTEVLTIEPSELDEAGFITFTTDKLSQFAFVSEVETPFVPGNDEGPTEDSGLGTGAIVGIVLGCFFLLLVIMYILGYFFLYRKGKLDEKKIKVIYKFLPRGDKNLEK